MFEKEVIIHLKFEISESKRVMAGIQISVQERKKIADMKTAGKNKLGNIQEMKILFFSAATSSHMP